MNNKVFINCPYDKQYHSFFKIIVYFCFYFGCEPLFASEILGASSRMDKIIDMIKQCDYGIHDISNVRKSKKTKLPRFNMPFELGLDMMCKYPNNISNILVLDGKNRNFEKCLSDLKGSDISAHCNRDTQLAILLRNFFISKFHLTNQKSPKEILYSYKLYFTTWLLEEMNQKGFCKKDTIEMFEYKELVRKYFNESNSFVR